MATKMNLAWRKSVISKGVERAIQAFGLSVELCEALTYLGPLAITNDDAFLALSRVAALPVDTEAKSVQDLERQRVEIQLYHTAATAKYY